MRVFLDTSALVKRYVDEPGSEEVAAALAETDDLVVSVVCLPEAISALRRLDREGRLAPPEYAALRAQLVDDLGDADVCQVAPEVVALAVECLERHRLRTLDALQLACARACGPDLFVTADHRQGAAAREWGLGVRVV